MTAKKKTSAAKTACGLPVKDATCTPAVDAPQPPRNGHATPFFTAVEAPTTTGRNITTFYRTGRFVTPPRTYSDLLRAWVQFLIYCVPPALGSVGSVRPSLRAGPGNVGPASVSTPASPTPTSTTMNTAVDGDEHEEEDDSVSPTAKAAQVPAANADFEAQVSTLMFIGVPHRVASYFQGVELLRDEGDGADMEATGDGEHQTEPITSKNGVSAGRKRERSNSRSQNVAPPATKRSAHTADHRCANEADAVAAAASGLFSAETMLQRLVEYGVAHLPAFDDDSAYLAAKDVLVYVKHYTYLASGMGLSAALLKSVEAAGLDFRRQCVPCMEAVTRLVRELTDAQLRKMAFAPRVVRLSERLHLSEKAARTFEYLLVCHCGRYAAGSVAEPLRPANIAYHNDLTPQELLSILSESGVLGKQGLAFSDIKMRSSFMECKYALPLETIAALSGDQLSEEQLIKLERTALSEVLNEEEHRKKAAAVAASPAPESSRGATAAASRAASASSTAHHHARGTAATDDAKEERAEEEEEEEEGGSDDDGDTASTAESTLTVTEDALEEALHHVDPQVLASGDADAIQEAVAQHFTKHNAKTSKPPTKPSEKAEDDTGDGTRKRTTEEVVDASSMTSASAAASPPPAEEPAKPTETEGDVGATATAAAAPYKPPLTLADINPLAQRYRHGASLASSSASPAAAAASQTDSSLRDTPYDSDIDYMDAAFRILANIIRIRYAEGDMKDEEDTFTPKTKVEASIRELKGKVRVAAAVHESRLRATLAANTFTPRIEQLAARLKLTEMEKQIMLFMVGNVISHDMLVAVNGRYVMRDGQRLITVGYMLFVLCETLEERVVARRAFYQSAPLISNGVLSLTLETVGRSCFNTDLMDYLVDIDRKIVDDVMGIVAETAEMVPGSQLYFPAVELSNVVLPSSTMNRVLSTIEHYSLFEQCKKRSGFGEGLGTSKGGLVMLFHGPSGTGKTMLANAVAHHLHKKILLVSISQFRSSTKAEADALKFLFREAKLNDAIIFFDECESLFEDRQSNATVTALLSEFERYDGLIILATNKAQNFDEAMNRRISLMMEFRSPDHQLRLCIWKSHIPKQLALAVDVSLEKLALNYELNGGLIRNAVLAALSQAVAREKSAEPTLTMADLDEGARLQLRGFFLAAERPEGMSEFYVTPKRTLAELVLEVPLAKKLESIASIAKSRSTLYTQWGFSEDANDDCGALYLFQGVSGTGKSLAAEGIAYECGATIRLCNVAELLLREEMRVHAVFEEGRRLGAIIVFDEAQVLFNESPKSLQLSQLIQYHTRRYPRPVVVIATTTSRDGSGGRQLFSTTSINSRSSCMLFQAELSFVLPSRPLREQLWRKAFPERVPIAPDVDYTALSAASISPKLIRTVAFNVCCRAALLPATQRTVTMAMIEAEVEKAAVRERSSISASAMFA